MTPWVGAKTWKKLDASDLDDPASGVKLIKGKASFLTPPAGQREHGVIEGVNV